MTNKSWFYIDRCYANPNSRLLRYRTRNKKSKMKKNLLLVLIFTIISCNSRNTNQTVNQENNKPITTIENARGYILENFKSNEETLLISDELNDSTGINMAIILDDILRLGYNVNGFEQREGYRIYKYKK